MTSNGFRPLNLVRTRLLARSLARLLPRATAHLLALALTWAVVAGGPALAAGSADDSTAAQSGEAAAGAAEGQEAEAKEAEAKEAEDKEAEDREAEDREAEDREAEDREASGQENQVPDLEVVEDNVAGIDAATSFDPMAVRQKLPPGFAVTTGTYRTEAQELQIIHVLRDDIPVLSIYPDSQGRIGLVQVFHPRVGVGEGHIGSPFESFFPDPEEADCVRGIDQLSGMLICTMTDSRRINLLFDGSAWDGPDDGMPPAEALRSWPLKYVIWSAEAGDGAQVPERPADR
ncbi:DUF1131 family protein [Marinibaculum pumilum]|uniref:DUF1131 family protein n=1 Tax=Marinibaculum pumilum TaxID=1766165 RepID=A0ABV7KVG7_9PROT